MSVAYAKSAEHHARVAANTSDHEKAVKELATAVMYLAQAVAGIAAKTK